MEGLTVEQTGALIAMLMLGIGIGALIATFLKDPVSMRKDNEDQNN